MSASSAKKNASYAPASWKCGGAIDRYKEIAERAAIQLKVGSDGYPPDLEILVKGVEINGKKFRFLREIPIDPMTRRADWGLRSMQDDPDSDSWDGNSVYNVYSKSEGTALDGTRYRDWSVLLCPT